LDPLCDLDDWRDELFEEAVNAKETRPEVMNEVDQKTLDVRTIMVLISHDHYTAISQIPNIFVLFANLKADNLSQILNLRVFRYLLDTRLPHI